MKVTVEIPDGKYCRNSKLGVKCILSFPRWRGYGCPFVEVNELKREVEQTPGHYYDHVLKHPSCLALKDK